MDLSNLPDQGSVDLSNLPDQEVPKVDLSNLPDQGTADAPAKSAGEIRNPTAGAWNLFPSTAGILKRKPDLGSMMLPLAPIADIFRDAGIAGKTALQQPLADKSMTFGSRLRHNLQSDTSLGTEVANNYLPAIAERALARGENPEDIANNLEALHKIISNVVDVGGFLGTGGPAGVTHAIEGGASLLNKFKGVQPAPSVSFQDSLARLEPAPASTSPIQMVETMDGMQPVPKPVTPPPDQTGAYQAWLQQNAQPATPRNPIMDVPLHPAEDARAMLAKLEPPNVIQQAAAAPVKQKPSPIDAFNVPGGQGQLGFRALLGKGTKRPFPQEPAALPYDQPLGPAREQGQQIFDFTKGPIPQEVSTPGATVAPTGPSALNQIRAQIRDLIAQPDSPENTAQIAALRKQIQDASAPVIDLKSATKAALAENAQKDLAKPVMPAMSTRQKLAFDTLRKKMTELRTLSAKETLSPAEEIHLEDLGKSIASLKKGLPPEAMRMIAKAPVSNAQPSFMDDIKTVLGSIQPDTGLNSGIPRMKKLSAEEIAARDRIIKEHLPKVLADMKATGKSMEESIKSLYPGASPTDAVALKEAMRIGNLNLRQYPDEQKQQLRELFAGKEDRLKTKPMTDAQITEKAKSLDRLPITEAIGRSGEGQTAAEIRRRVMTDIARMKAISEDKNLSAQETVQRMLQVGTEQTKKVKTEIGRALGGMKLPLEAQQEQLTSLRKIVDRLRADPNLSSSESKALIAQMKGQFPDLEKATTPAEMFKFMFRNFITSSPRTLLINATSGYGNIAARPVMRTLEVTSAKIRSLMSGKPTSATYKEIGAMLKGMQDAIGGGKLPESLRAKTFSDRYNVSPMEAMAATAKTKTAKTALDISNKAISYPETIMRKTDDQVKNILGMMEMYASKARGEDVLADQHAIERITSAQARGTFQDEMSSIGKWVAQSRNYFSHQPPTAFNQSMDVFTYAIQPFIQTVDRIIAKGWNTSVLGGPTVAVRGALGKYRNNGELLDRDIASAMIGIPIFVWAGSQLASGNITGAAPSDTAGREAFNNAGKTEYSVKVGSRWIPLRDLPEPMSTALQLNLSLIQGITQAKDKGKDMMEGAFSIVQQVGTMLGTKQYLGGMNSLINSMSAKGADTVNELPLSKKLLPSVVVPSVVKDVGVIKDTLKNRPRVMADTAVEALKRRAGLTSGMVPELNTFGEAVTHPMMGKVNNNPAYALAEKFPPQPVERTREGVKLSQQDYHDLKQNVGQQRKKVYTALANNPRFMKASSGLQQTIVEEMVATADEVGSAPQKMKELRADPLYYDRKLRTLLEIKKPGGERHFPYLK